MNRRVESGFTEACHGRKFLCPQIPLSRPGSTIAGRFRFVVAVEGSIAPIKCNNVCVPLFHASLYSTSRCNNAIMCVSLYSTLQ
jgi:hypothetical protein